MENSQENLWLAIRLHHEAKIAMQQAQLAEYQSLDWTDQYGLAQLQLKHLCELMELQRTFLLELAEIGQDKS